MRIKSSQAADLVLPSGSCLVAGVKHERGGSPSQQRRVKPDIAIIQGHVSELQGKHDPIHNHLVPFRVSANRPPQLILLGSQVFYYLVKLSTVLRGRYARELTEKSLLQTNMLLYIALHKWIWVEICSQGHTVLTVLENPQN